MKAVISTLTSNFTQDPEDWKRLRGAAKAFLLLSMIGVIFSYSTLSLLGLFAPESGFIFRVFSSIASFWGFAGGPFLMSQISSKPLNTLSHATSPFAATIYTSPELAKYNKYRAKFEAIRPNLCSENVKKIEQLLKEYKDKLYDETDAGWKDTILRNSGLMFDAIFKILEKPNLKSISKQELNNKIEKLLQVLNTYPEQREILINFSKIIGYNQFHKQDLKKMQSLYMVGESGTGKTSIIRKICEIFGMNLIIRQGKTCISYAYCQKQPWDPFELHKVSVLGQSLLASNNKGSTGYTVIFFDEIDKLPREGNSAISSNGIPTLNDVAQTLLDITDPDNPSRDIYTDIIYPNHNVIVAVAVNECILDLIPGLRRRFGDNIIKYGAIPKQIKHTIALDSLAAICQEHSIATEQFVAVVNDMVENDAHPGVGILIENIKALVQTADCNNYYNETELYQTPTTILHRFNKTKPEQAKPKHRTHKCTIM